MKKTVASLVLAALLVSASTIGIAQDKTDWQKDIDWAANDTGAPDCPELYGGPLINCISIGLATGNNSGNRACAVDLAIFAAKNGSDYVAYSYTLVTQCHNGREEQNLINAGPRAIADYLRTF